MSIAPIDAETASRIILALGGPPEVGRMTKAPVTTVHGWLRNGMSAARVDHLALAAARDNKSAVFDGALGAAYIAQTNHNGCDTAAQHPRETGNDGETSAQAEAA